MTTPSPTLAALAAVMTAGALMLATRSQDFTNAAVDGHALRMLVAGTGDATVVFENGCCPSLESWDNVQREVSRFATTVAYDRAGIGLSADGPLPRDGARIAAELHRALELAGFPPPYVLVGASLGGPYVRIFAGLYPDEVAALVLVDPTHDAEDFAELEDAGIPELDAWPETRTQARDSPVPPGVPVFLIDARAPADVPFATAAIREARAEGQRELAAESLGYEEWLAGVPRGELVVTEQSGHNVAIEQPELVVTTIRRAVEAARATRGRESSP